MILSQTHHCARAILFLIVSLISPGQSRGSVITLDLNSLPSSQGWAFEKINAGNHANDIESSVFSVAANTLTMNTMPEGFVSPSGVGYTNSGVVNATLPWTLEWTLRVVDYEFFSGTPTNDFGSWFAVYNDVSLIGVAVSDVAISIVDNSGVIRILRDNTSFQDFKFEYTPDAGSGIYDLFINNSLITSGVGDPAVGGFFHTNQLFIGDGTGAANSQWEITNYVFTQDTSSVPEPCALVLFCIGSIALCGYRLRRRNFTE